MKYAYFICQGEAVVGGCYLRCFFLGSSPARCAILDIFHRWLGERHTSRHASEEAFHE